jgi:hypothetical protein
MANRAGDARYADGIPVPDLRITQQGALVVTQINGDGYESAIRRNTYSSMAIARATSLGSTTMVGHILWNPPDSGVNLVLRKWSSSVHVTSATTTGILLAAGYQSTQPTAVTAVDRIGSTYLTVQGATNQLWRTGKVQAYAAATLLFAPLAVWLLHHNTAAIATTGVDGMFDDIESFFIAPPGGIICMMAQGAAVAAAGHTSGFIWDEIPVVGIN